MVEDAAVAALRAAYVKFLLRPTKQMTREEKEDAIILQAFQAATPSLSLPPVPFPATMMKKMLKMLTTKTRASPKKFNDDPTEETKMTAAEDEDDDEMMKKKPPDAETEEPKKTKMKQDEKEDKEKKKMEEDPPPKDPDNDIGVSPIENPGDPKEEGNSFPLPSPTALHLQGPFPGG
jgi:hypothetical protein